MNTKRRTLTFKLTILLAVFALHAAPRLWAQQSPGAPLPELNSPGSYHFLPALGRQMADSDISMSEKSPGVAFTLSIMGTGIPIAAGIANWEKDRGATPAVLIASGLVFGPAIGYFYGGLWGRGLLGTGIRLGTLGASALLISATVEPSLNALAGLVVIGIIAVGFVAVDALYDVFVVAKNVREQNDLNRVFGVRVLPTWSFATHSPGVRITIGL